MAGGIGSRFWPKSRKAMPKQFLDMMGSGKSSLRHTYERFLELIPADNFLVVTNVDYRELVAEQIPELRAEQILCEPIGRNTAPSICYAAYSLFKRDPKAEVLITPADHYINDEDELRQILSECFDFVSDNNALLTVGVRPTRPEIRYGYIQVSDNSTISRAKSFTEKPIMDLAQIFIQCGEFYWNTGIIVSKVGDIIAAIEAHLPDNHALFNSIMEHYGTATEAEAIAAVFAECRSTSIDYGVMSRAQNVYIRVADLGWSDVGTWDSIYQLVEKDEAENMESEMICAYNSHRCIISLPSNKAAVVSGLDDYIVVDTDDILMICPRSEEQEIKRYIDDLRYKLGDKFI